MPLSAQVSQAVARFRRGETVYYVGLRSSTMMLEYGQRGVVHCDPEGECYDVLFDGHSRIVRFGHDDDWPLSELCRAPPPVLLAGRFTVGETLYYTGDTEVFPCGDELQHGCRGRVLGPDNDYVLADFKGDDEGYCIRMGFEGCSNSLHVPPEELSHDDPLAGTALRRARDKIRARREREAEVLAPLAAAFSMLIGPDGRIANERVQSMVEGIRPMLDSLDKEVAHCAPCPALAPLCTSRPASGARKDACPQLRLLFSLA